MQRIFTLMIQNCLFHKSLLENFLSAPDFDVACRRGTKSNWWCRSNKWAQVRMLLLELFKIFDSVFSDIESFGNVFNGNIPD
jgi:hypothetical protein